MSYHSSIATRDQDITDVEAASTNFAEENLLEMEANHPDKFTTHTKIEDSEQRSMMMPTHLSLSTTSSNCPLHPEEILQFYCFNNNSLLCAECLVKGKYSGMDIANLRRAADKLKGKLTELARESTAKIEDCAVIGKEIEEQQNQIKDMFSGYKDEIREKINVLRQALAHREQELLRKIDGIQEEKLSVIDTTETSLRSYKEGIEVLSDTVQNKLSDLDDLSICRFYVSKADAFKENLNDEICTRIQRVKKLVDRHHIQDQVNFFKLREEWQKAQAAINELGNGISNKSASPSRKETMDIGSSQRTLNTEHMGSYNSVKERSPDNQRLYRDTLKAQTVKNQKPRHQQSPSSFISSTGSGALISPKTSPRQTSARGPLVVEIRRGDLSKSDLNNNSTINKTTSPTANNYRNPANKLYEVLNSPKNAGRTGTGNPPYVSTTSFISTSPRQPLTETIFLSQSPKYSINTGSKLLEASTSQLGTYKTLSDLNTSKERLLSPERKGQGKNDSFAGLEEFLNRKGQDQVRVQSPTSGNLKNRLKELNSKMFK